MTSFDAYKLYLAVKLHFTTENYDFFKHNAKVNCSLNSFLKRNDRFFFHKLATKYNNEELLYYYVSNFLDRPKTWVGDLVRTDGAVHYNRWKKYNESFSYNLRSDCVLLSDRINADSIRFDDMFRISSGQHPLLLRLLISKKIRMETVIILDKILTFIKHWDKEIKEKVVWPDISKQIKKYSPFVKQNLTKSKFIMREVFNDNNT